MKEMFNQSKFEMQMCMRYWRTRDYDRVHEQLVVHVITTKLIEVTRVVIGKEV
jgi:hypothetical protein